MKEKSYEQILYDVVHEDKIDKPKHYQGAFGLEAIEVVRNFMTTEEIRGFYKGNTLKYILREAKKNGLEDLKKARKNLDWLIDEMEKINE